MIFKTMNRLCDETSRQCEEKSVLQLWESPAVPGAVAFVATVLGGAEGPGKCPG